MLGVFQKYQAHAQVDCPLALGSGGGRKIHGDGVEPPF